ncbi:MAG: hypothetical protein R3D29_10205 [Nitratireductor sp.]
MNKPAASFIIRPAQPGDVAAIVPLVKASWARTYDPAIGEAARRKISDAKHVPDLFLAEIRDPDKAGLLAESDGKVIGHVGGFSWKTAISMLTTCMSTRHRTGRELLQP